MSLLDLLRVAELGHVFEAPSLMPGLTKEELVLQVVERQGDRVTLRITFFGVHLGTRTVVIENGELVWL